MKQSIMSCVNWRVYLGCQATLGQSTSIWSVLLCIGRYGLRVGVAAECFRTYMRWCLSWCQHEITWASADWQHYRQRNQPQLWALQMSHQQFLTFLGPSMWVCVLSGGHCIHICAVCRIGCTWICWSGIHVSSFATRIESHSFRSQPLRPVSNCQPSGSPPPPRTRAAWDFMIRS